ncbi:hypothetical protein [Prevotella histicola]
MKNLFVLPIFTVIFLSSCGTYAGSGAMTGGSLGSVLGSAIGGIAGGGRGSNIGTIVGMAGGAMVGATIGAKADKHNKSSIVDNVYDSQDNSHIDTCVSIQDRGVAPSDTVEHNVFLDNRSTPYIEITNAYLSDNNHDGVLSRNEEGKLIFDITNYGTVAVNNIQPSVVMIADEQDIQISPSINVVTIAPGKTIRYTATIKAGKKLTNGSTTFALTVLQGKRSICKVNKLEITTRK